MLIETTVINPTPVKIFSSDSPPSLITGEELAAMGDIGRTELVKGEIIHLMPTRYPHGFYEVNLATFLKVFVRTHKLGSDITYKSPNRLSYKL